jgi:hypothetical protein
MFGIHCPTGCAESFGYVLLGFSVSIVSPPMIVFVIDLAELRGCCGKRELLLMSVSSEDRSYVTSQDRDQLHLSPAAGFRPTVNGYVFCGDGQDLQHRTKWNHTKPQKDYSVISSTMRSNNGFFRFAQNKSNKVVTWLPR